MKQNYNLDIITSLFHQYFPEQKILSYSLCDGGIENSNFLIITEGGKYILKVFESHRHEEEVIRSEVEIMIASRNAGSSIPEVFLTKKDLQNVIPGPSGRLTILMEYIDGVKYRETPLTAELLFHLGQRVAEFHGNLTQLEGKYTVPETHFFDLKYIFEHDELRSIRPEYADPELIKSVWKDLDNAQPNLLSFPRQIIHNDLHDNNIIYRNGEPYFIDFSDMVHGPCIADIAILLTAFCFRVHWIPEGMTEFLKGYEAIRKLSSEEKNYLFPCLEARLVNILMIPYLDTDIGDYEELKEYISENYEWLVRLHGFGKENFDKFIP